MTLKGGTSQACASCKYQRRKCSSECPLAPYFPPDQPKMFQNAHKLFGVRKILKILENLESHQQEEAMRSIIYQANIRDRFPVHGCWGIICKLHFQIRQVEEELHAVLAHLEMYRQQQIAALTKDVTSQLELGMAPPQPCLAQQYSYSIIGSNIGYSSNYLDSNDNVGNSLWGQHPYATNYDTNSMPIIQSQLVASQQLASQQEEVQNYDEMHPFFDTIDDRQSYIETKEPYESRCVISLHSLFFFLSFNGLRFKVLG
ncbi:LOB DOMAIN-CONTAINING PROTEIN 4-RELATED [Salix purpurea]|uniref:LOB DOMAIN-CONTAINING PROTEIN 4-RELATED n=1 Tax=Salix purpurea TaxID=77065 RepID=A0A9Q0W5L3_SALPP|nr:LOB DOMAIN-CONTAINING PROTEIN 4-RELATED [Salix purpurea]